MSEVQEPRRKRQRGRSKIDWDSAFAAYASDPTLGYRGLARLFAVSETAVRHHANAGGWPEKAAALRERAAERQVLRSLEQRNRETIRVADRLRRVALDEGAELDARTAVAHLPAYAKLEQLFAGEATDRVQVSEVRGLVAAYTEVFLELAGLARRVDPGRTERAVRRLDEELARLAVAAGQAKGEVEAGVGAAA